MEKLTDTGSADEPSLSTLTTTEREGEEEDDEEEGADTPDEEKATVASRALDGTDAGVAVEAAGEEEGEVEEEGKDGVGTAASEGRVVAGRREEGGAGSDPLAVGAIEAATDGSGSAAGVGAAGWAVKQPSSQPCHSTANRHSQYGRHIAQLRHRRGRGGVS